ncbi:MAG: hypothetical protein AABZ00_14505 [Chloroflexota bacterium]
MTRLLIYLSEEEKTALQAMAEREMRGLREQTRLILRQELERCGLLQAGPARADTLPKQVNKIKQEGMNVTG